MTETKIYTIKEAIGIVNDALKSKNLNRNGGDKIHRIEILTKMLWILTCPPCSDCRYLSPRENYHPGYIFIKCLRGGKPYEILWNGRYPTDPPTCNNQDFPK